MQVRIHLIPSMNFIFEWVQRCLYWRDLLASLGSLSEFAFHVKAFVCVYTAIHMQKTTTGHLMTMHVMFSEFMRQRLCTLCFPNSCAKDYLTAGGCRECHSSAANEDGYDILWYRSGTLDRRTCLIMSFHFRDGMWLTQEPPCRLMIWTWFHLFIKDDGLRILSGMYNHIVIAVHFQKSKVCVCVCTIWIDVKLLSFFASSFLALSNNNHNNAGEWWAMMKSPLNEDASSFAVIWRRDAFVTYLPFSDIARGSTLGLIV